MNQAEFVNLEERARTAISLGESHFREFKSALHGSPERKVAREVKSIGKDIGEALVAFANADGGELLVGVEDDGAITGIDCVAPSKLEFLTKAAELQVHEKTPLPPVRIATLKLDDRQVLYFSVSKSTSHVHLTSDGRCLQRRDLETVPIAPHEILFDRKERASRSYDREYLDGATAADLNGDLVKAVADQLSPGMSVEKCLQYLDLAEYIGPGLRLRRAALLLFAKDPNRWHPRLQIRILKIAGTAVGTGPNYNAKSDQVVTGNILELIERGWDGLRPQLVQTRLGQGARFQSTVMYPELACREALLNAIAHRDFSEEGRAIEIFVFDDRMEVRNPGGLLSSITLDDLLTFKGIHQSRNAMISRVLRELGYMRELGEGMRRMFELMRANELTAPELVSDSNSFGVTLRHSTIYSPQQVLWLQHFDNFNLNREQKAIVVLGMGGTVIAPQDVWDNLGIVDTEYYRQLVRSLQDLQILSSEIPKTEAQRLAKKRRTSVRKIPRFRIAIPKATELAAAKTPPSRIQRIELDAAADAPDSEAQLWIANLPYSVDEAALIDHLSAFGEVENVHIPKDPDGKSRGYGFVEFSSPDEANRLLNELNEKDFQGRRMVVRKALPRSRDRIK
ncbi:MAG: ATP-binding protein [Planctomycetaceae bacterium]